MQAISVPHFFSLFFSVAWPALLSLHLRCLSFPRYLNHPPGPENRRQFAAFWEQAPPLIRIVIANAFKELDKVDHVPVIRQYDCQYYDMMCNRLNNIKSVGNTKQQRDNALLI